MPKSSHSWAEAVERRGYRVRIKKGKTMISNHTNRSIPAADLAARGKLTHIVGDSYRLDIPADKATGVGPVGSYWTAEAGEHELIQSMATVVAQAEKPE